MVSEMGSKRSTSDIQLSVCPLKCTILLIALFIDVKIQIKKSTFHDEITLNQIETMFQTLRKQQKEFQPVCLCLCVCVFTITSM